MVTAKREIYPALSDVQHFARKRIEEYEAKIGQPSDVGWTQEKHDNYYREQIKRASEAFWFCEHEMRRISPD